MTLTLLFILLGSIFGFNLKGALTNAKEINVVPLVITSIIILGIIILESIRIHEATL